MAKRRHGLRAVISFAIAAGGLWGLPAHPCAAAEFFASKTITISTYGAAGDSYDAYMRLLTRHYGRHIPGNPRFTAINQTGAGGLVAINHAAMVAPQDGTFITVASQGLLIFEATGQRGLQTSIGNFKWLGSFTQSNNVTITWHTSTAKRLQDAIDREVVVGASGAAGGSVIGPAIYNAVLGTKFKVVYGYQGGAHIDLAMKRGEVEGRGNNTWAGYKATMPNEVRDGLLNVLIQTGLRKDRDLPHVPLFIDLVRGDVAGEPVAQFMSQAVAIARPVARRPAFRQIRSISCVAHSMRPWRILCSWPGGTAQGEIDPLSGEQVQDIVRRVLGTPTPVLDQIKATLGLRSPTSAP
jgi:tripartite-type tricarboxylate transporter receptor subunit TctC